MDEHMHWRSDFHPEDRMLSTPKEMRSEEYQTTLDRTSEVLMELSNKLKETSMPWFSARYLGHMNTDTLMVANLPYMATIIYNSNSPGVISPPTARLQTTRACGWHETSNLSRQQ